MALGTLTGLLLLTRLPPLLGSQMLALFLLSGLLRFAVAAIMLPKLREVPKGVPAHTVEPGKAPAVVVPMVASGVLFYRPQHWESFAASDTVKASKAEVNVPSKKGLFHKPREWSLFRSRVAAGQGPVEMAAKRGLFHKPQEWEHFGQKAMATIMEPALAKAPFRKGLFYRPGEWAAFSRQS